MSKKIIVAGAGHGGIAAAALLSKKGYDVTVYEKNERENMGYDWTDIFDKKCFKAADIDMPEKFCLKQDMTFFGPAQSIALRQHTDPDKLEIQMERKDLYDHLIAHAESCGVKFEFGTEIEGPVMCGNRVVGIKTKKGEQYAELVIDACGINSPVRMNLPEYLGIENEAKQYERFYVYRAFFNKIECEVEDKFKILMLFENILGICWVASEEEYTDVLIGRFNEMDIEEVERTLAVLRETNPSLGDKIVRGGQFVQIPVRQPLGVMVADGYAAIGDSAFMTVPIIGSGIANSIKAAKMLCDAIVEDKDETFSAKALWKYQTKYYKELGNGLAPLAAVKLLLTKLEGNELDYIFENGILNADDMTIDSEATSIGAILGGMNIDDLKLKVTGLLNNKNVLMKVLSLGKDMAAITAATAIMPKEYDINKVTAWVKKYNNCFKR